jgi:catechol 2,3-dioxygenase-like lactoylglutathione lyase family enzyme
MTAWLPTMRSPAALKKPKPMIERFDHIVLTVADLEPSIAFYNQVLQMQEHSFGQGRKALCFGRQKITASGRTRATQQSGHRRRRDLCLITTWTPQAVRTHLQAECIDLLAGPVIKSGTLGPIISIYFNDPDTNLIEVSSYERNTA